MRCVRPSAAARGRSSGVHPVDLSASVLTALAARNRLDPELVEDIIWGCVTQIADQSTNVGRLAVLAAGWPEAIPGVTIDRACGSSQQAVHFAAASVIAGHYDVVIAGGVESMSRVPLGAARATGEPFGPRVQERYQRDSFSQGLGAEDDRAPVGLVPRPAGRVRARVPPARRRPRPTPAPSTGSWSPSAGRTASSRPTRASAGTPRWRNWPALKPAFREDGVIHAGNSSQISDGCARPARSPPASGRPSSACGRWRASTPAR